jgi:hypothetical protein
MIKVVHRKPRFRAFEITSPRSDRLSCNWRMRPPALTASPILSPSSTICSQPLPPQNRKSPGALHRRSLPLELRDCHGGGGGAPGRGDASALDRGRGPAGQARIPSIVSQLASPPVDRLLRPSGAGTFSSIPALGIVCDADCGANSAASRQPRANRQVPAGLLLKTVI